MKQELELTETKPYFSFGGVKNSWSQTDFEETESPYNK